MTEHTPGPWEYKKEFGREGLILTPEGEAIAAFMPDGVGNEARMEANARLIAAAPELLAVCEMLATTSTQQDYYVTIVGNLNAIGVSAPSSIALAMEKARAAIAKARGT